MKAADFEERRLELAGWAVNISSYRLDELWHAAADNVSPGANLCRTTGATREEAERKAIERAQDLLSRTKRHQV